MKQHQFHSGLAWTKRDGVTNSEVGRKLYQQAKADYLKREELIIKHKEG